MTTVMKTWLTVNNMDIAFRHYWIKADRHAVHIGSLSAAAFRHQQPHLPKSKRLDDVDDVTLNASMHDCQHLWKF